MRQHLPARVSFVLARFANIDGRYILHLERILYRIIFLHFFFLLPLPMSSSDKEPEEGSLFSPSVVRYNYFQIGNWWCGQKM